VRVGVYQFAPVFGDVRSNLMRVEQALADVEADLIVLPELFNTGYTFTSAEEARALAEEVPGGPTTEFLLRLAQKKKMILAGGLAEIDVREGKVFNSAVMAGPEGYIGKYRKIHLFGSEKLWFSPGDLGFPVFDAGGVKLGLMICFDWFFPEAARVLALKGAQIICHPANLVLPFCPQAMITRSLENFVISITANRTGREQRGNFDLRFVGQSQVVDVMGQLKFRLDEEEERAAVTEVDPRRAADKRLNSMNQIWEDRRPEYYLSLAEK